MLNQAAAQHQAGQWAPAETLYRQVLAFDPNQPDALHLYGVLLQQTGRAAPAEQAIRRAIALQPKAGAYHNNLGNLLRDTGRLREAVASYRAALRLLPNMPQIHHHLGLALDGLGETAAAETALRQAIRLQKDFAEARLDLGNLLSRTGKPRDAEVCLRAALRVRPDDPKIVNALGTAQAAQGLQEQAVETFLQALALDGSYRAARANLGVSLMILGRAGEAVAQYEALVASEPDDASSHLALGQALIRLDRPAEALPWLDRAIVLRPADGQSHHCRGIALRDLGRWAEALPCYEQAAIHQPDDAAIRDSLAEALLAVGDMRRGWQEFEWRRKKPDYAIFAEPSWDGQPTEKTVLVHAEQGLGDTLQFCRFVPLAAARARVVFAGPTALAQLLIGLRGMAAFVEREPLPPFDLQIPLMSLPYVLGVAEQTLPGPIPYLQADEAAVAEWRTRLDGPPGLRVGLVWAGNPKFPNDRRRSVPFSTLAPLLAVPGVSFVSLQKGPAAADHAGTLQDPTALLEDFADTAALIAALDLVISVDTAVLHLAGALGRPVWLLNRADTCWRWMLQREDSPWYPDLRIFRQTTPGSWQPVIEEVAHELAGLAVAAQSSR